MVHEPGLLPYRIVIPDLGDQHVVHTHVFEPERKPWYHQGDSFTIRNVEGTARESDADTLRKAWACFEERARRSLGTDSPPSRKLARVTDVTEMMINALHPMTRTMAASLSPMTLSVSQTLSPSRSSLARWYIPRMTIPSWVTSWRTSNADFELASASPWSRRQGRSWSAQNARAFKSDPENPEDTKKKHGNPCRRHSSGKDRAIQQFPKSSCWNTLPWRD